MKKETENKSYSVILNKIKEYKEYIFLFIVVCALCLMVLYSSPLYKGLPDIDSSVFQVMGKGMLEHKIMYKELFDHKGPIVYIINALAYLISNNNGLFIIETIIFYIGTIFVYKTSRIVLSKELSIVVNLLYMLISFRYFYGGNYTEEYASTFMSMAMYFIIKILHSKEINKKFYWIMIGSTFTINLLIKPTYISIWVAFGMVQLISSIKDKKIKELIKNTGYMLVGILIILVPIIMYLIINNDIKDFIDAYIIMNMKYSNSSVLTRIVKFKELVTAYKYNRYLLIMLVGNVMIIFSKKTNKRTKSFITLFSVISIVLTAWAPNAYSHYLIQLAPCVILESIFLLYIIDQKIKEKEISNYKIIRELPIKFIYICVIFVIIFNVFSITTKSKGIFSKKMLIDQLVIDKVSEINNYLNEDDKILVLGNNSYYYLIFNKKPNFKYFFQYPLIKYDEEIIDETAKYIMENKPKVIIDEEYNDINICGQQVNVQTYGEKISEVIFQNYEEHDIKLIKYYVLKGE